MNRAVKTVLVVDDEQAILGALTQILAAEPSLAVVTASDGEAALAMMAQQPIDMVISDRRMPGMDGIVLLNKIKQLYPDIPRMLLTGHDDTRPNSKGGPVPDDLPVVQKPWDRAALVQHIRLALEPRTDDGELEELARHGVTQAQIDRAMRVRAKLQQTRSVSEILVELGALTSEIHDKILVARRSRMSIVDLLRSDGLLSDDDHAAYLQAKSLAPSLSERALLVEGRLVTEENFLRAQCATLGMRYVEPEVGAVDQALLGKASLRYLVRHNVLPVSAHDGRVSVIVADPQDRELLVELERIFGMPVDASCASATRIGEALQTLQRLRGGVSDGSTPTVQYREIEDAQAGEENGEEAVQIVDYLLARAVQLRASDLHIEPMQTKIRVRVRVDGVLQQLTDLPLDFAPRVVSRIKILAGADISEKRMHQDGKIFVKVEGSEIDIRVSSYVSVFGETIVMRLLDRNRGLVPLEKIGFTPRAFGTLTDIVLETSSGLVLVVGPTGSGKTTTLYSFIDHANDPTEKVITCEDPVEYMMEGIVQCSVNQKTGPTFEDSLRAIVRQDPDSIVVGEIRDETTVGLALESALTGHKVFSTFHTEDAVGAFVRLLEMGAEPFLVASTVSAVIAQRLVRQLCPKCKRPGEPSRSELRFVGLDRAELRGQTLYQPGGCARCEGSGFKGRVAIHEVLVPDDDFRDTVLRRAPAKELRQAARKLPEFLTLQEDGVLKALSGVTTVGEVVANSPRDTAARPLAKLKEIGAERRGS